MTFPSTSNGFCVQIEIDALKIFNCSTYLEGFLIIQFTVTNLSYYFNKKRIWKASWTNGSPTQYRFDTNHTMRCFHEYQVFSILCIKINEIFTGSHGNTFALHFNHIFYHFKLIIFYFKIFLKINDEQLTFFLPHTKQKEMADRNWSCKCCWSHKIYWTNFSLKHVWVAALDWTNFLAQIFDDAVNMLN